jgi:hypothetical protein
VQILERAMQFVFVEVAVETVVDRGQKLNHPLKSLSA